VTLHDEWSGGDRPLRRLDILLHTVFYPFACVVFLCMCGRYPKTFNVPFARRVTLLCALDDAAT